MAIPFIKTALFLFAKGIGAMNEDIKQENSRIKSLFKTISRYPIKLIATYLAAPVLIFNIARATKNPLRRRVAILGLSLSIFFAYASATLLGSLIGASLVASSIGYIAALGFLIGSTTSVVLSVMFSILIFNSVSYLFLKLSAEDVLEHLKKCSE